MIHNDLRVAVIIAENQKKILPSHPHLENRTVATKKRRKIPRVRATVIPKGTETNVVIMIMRRRTAARSDPKDPMITTTTAGGIEMLHPTGRILSAPVTATTVLAVTRKKSVTNESVARTAMRRSIRREGTNTAVVAVLESSTTGRKVVVIVIEEITIRRRKTKRAANIQNEE